MEEAMMSSLTDSFRRRAEFILIVDDEPANLRLLWAYLDQANFKVLAARDGRAPFRLRKTAQPDIILLDVMMPGLDGFETCRQLQVESTHRGPSR
jgi:DNA-binding response OmpR family regulator